VDAVPTFGSIANRSGSAIASRMIRKTRIADELRDDGAHARSLVRAATLGAVDLRSQRIYEAQREGVFRRLCDGGLSERRARALINGWEQEARTRALTPLGPGYWREGLDWIAEQRQR